MDWLSTSHATIHFQKGCVIFRVPNHPEFIFQRGAESIEPARSWMILNCGTLLIMKTVDEHIPDVEAEFLDVFEDVTELPPEQDIKFSITVLPDTGIISKAPLEWHQSSSPN